MPFIPDTQPERNIRGLPDRKLARLRRVEAALLLIIDVGTRFDEKLHNAGQFVIELAFVNTVDSRDFVFAHIVVNAMKSLIFTGITIAHIFPFLPPFLFQ